MLFESVTPAPPDAILGLTDAFRKDSNPSKVNLGVGVYMDDSGRTPVLESVKRAERKLLESEKSKSYLPISGSPGYGRRVQDLLFGEKHPFVGGDRVRTAHTPGGTGALRVGAEFLKKAAPGADVWLSAPTWPNHKGIFAASGFKVREYPYYDATAHGLNFDGLAAGLRAVPAGDIVLLHVCCHNPTGVDLTREQWAEVAAIARERKWIPFFDFAYQGLGVGLDEDRDGLAVMLGSGLDDALIASSFSKNFGLYNERVGGLTLIARDAAAADAAFSQVKATIRVIYSNPPAHGEAIVSAIFDDADLRKLWESEVAAMRQRIAGVRTSFVAGLKARNAPMDFSFINHQRGMFSFSGLSDAQVSWLREKRSIYVVGGGRINVAGITTHNLDYLCDSVVEAMRQAG